MASDWAEAGLRACLQVIIFRPIVYTMGLNFCRGINYGIVYTNAFIR